MAAGRNPASHNGTSRNGAGPRIGVRKTYKLYIGGAFPRSESGRSYLVSAADGTPLAGAQGLRRFVVKRPERYAHTFAAKMMTYALGRHVDHRDQPALRRLVRNAAASGYRWSDIVLGIVTSSPFQMRKSAS